MTVARNRVSGPIGGTNGLQARIYPNGETVVWKPRATKMEPMVAPHQYDEAGLFCACMRAYGTIAPALAAGLVPLGSSPLPIFDKLPQGAVPGLDDVLGSRTRQGLKGITPFGARIVRNAAHLIERKGGRGRCVFSTCTLPNLPLEEMRMLHENFAKVVELFRLGIRRVLQNDGLSGESVTVVEVQEKRYQRTGMPVLHIHTVFVGKNRSGQWAISTENHDKIWKNALRAVLGRDDLEVGSSCNLQRVKKSTEGYIGKYMTKGCKVVREIVGSGYAGWMPKHWWSCSRSLRHSIDAETRRADKFADWLNDMADVKSADVWMWHRDVEIELFSGDVVTMARYGRLTPPFNRWIREVLDG